MKRNTQLQLINTHSEWRLDASTIEVGKSGLEMARAALRNSPQRQAIAPQAA